MKRLFDSIGKKTKAIVDTMAKQPRTKSQTLIAIYESAISAARDINDRFDSFLSDLDMLYTMIQVPLNDEIKLEGIQFDKFDPTIIKTALDTALKTVETALDKSRKDWKNDPIFTTIIKRITVLQYNIKAEFAELLEYARIVGVEQQSTPEPSDDSEHEEEPPAEEKPAEEKPAEEKPIKTEPEKTKPVEEAPVEKHAKMLPIPNGFIRIDFIESIDPARYCMDKNCNIIDRKTYERVIPEKTPEGVIVYKLINTNDVACSYTSTRLLYKAGFLQSVQSEEAPAATATESKPEDEALPVMDVKYPNAALILTDTNIPSDKYMITPKAIVWDRYTHRRLIRYPDKSGQLCVKLVGLVKNGNKNPTTYERRLSDLMRKVYGMDYTGEEDDCSRPDRVSIQTMTRDCEELKKPAEPEVEPVQDKPTEPSVSEETVSTKPSPYCKYIDFMDRIPPKKYVIYSTGVVKSVANDNMLVPFINHATSRYTVVTLSSSVSETGAMGHGAPENFMKQIPLYKLMAIAFLGMPASIIKLRGRYGTPEALGISFKDGNPRNVALDNLQTNAVS